MELVDVLILALGNLNDALSNDDMWAILDLYTTVLSACKEEHAAVETLSLWPLQTGAQTPHYQAQKRKPSSLQRINHLTMGPRWVRA